MSFRRQAEANDMELATTKGRPHVAARGRPKGAPTEDVDHVGWGLPGAPDLPPGGKVPPKGADEGATYGTVPINGIPQSPPRGGDSPLSQGGRAFALPVIPRPRRGRGNPSLTGNTDCRVGPAALLAMTDHGPAEPSWGPRASPAKYPQGVGASVGWQSRQRLCTGSRGERLTPSVRGRCRAATEGVGRSSGMRELSPLGESEREGELARRAKRDRPGAYGACDDKGRGILDAPP